MKRAFLSKNFWILDVILEATKLELIPAVLFYSADLISFTSMEVIQIQLWLSFKPMPNFSRSWIDSWNILFLTAIKTPPTFTVTPPTQVYYYNTSGCIIECKAAGHPPPTIKWLYSPSPSIHQDRGTLIIRGDLDPSYTPFICLASNSLGTIRSPTVTVQPGE